MSDSIKRETFEQSYDERPPWDIDGPQEPFRKMCTQLRGKLLDAGCGTGENALCFAAQGLTVTGIDFVERAILRAREKAKERGLAATFLVKDALTLATWDQRFDTVIDSGLFHVFGDAERVRYVEGVHTVLRPGGIFLLMCFSDRTPGTNGPRRISQPELEATFSGSWVIKSLEHTAFEVRADALEKYFDGVPPKAWFVTLTKTASK
jgi:cyclopropane fatty-acyl-phospholipid synthase-like methyltransferase